MFDYRKIKQELIWIIYDMPGEFQDDYDICGIMDELRDMEISSIDDVDDDDFWEIMKRHDNSWHDPVTGGCITATEWYERADKYGW